ncbi:MAG: pyridoxal-phosphate-dependent aminotransferase family protein [Candidatus Saliniplasma sp.]
MLMTPGPTEIPKSVRKAMSKKILNPDIDTEFFEFYHGLEKKVKEVYRTEDDVLILGGEGILGLEAAVASLIDKEDKVLCISNGIYGDGFADFVKMYGGEPVMVRSSYDKSLNVEEVGKKLDEDEFKAATMVHCETPTGVLNDLGEILEMLEDQGVLSIVDAVSSLGGTEVPVDMMDICIGGSQKCFSSPPGLTTISISECAWKVMEDKEQNSYYTNLPIWKDMWFGDEYFPYTHLVSNLYALDESMDIILGEGLENVFDRHESMAVLCRERVHEMDLDIYPSEESLSSPTVTAIKMDGKALKVQKKMKKEHDILLANSLGDLENEILRIGHMGHNAYEEKVVRTMDALEDVLDGM